jgi:lipooligosaccharide transport system ATP-binding protein
MVWERLYKLKSEGVTLILTTHYMDEAEQLCDRLVVMDNARIVAEGTPRALIERYSSREVLELRFEDLSTPPLEGKDGGLIERTEQLPDRVLLYTGNGEALGEKLYAEGIRPVSSLVRRSSLEDVFLRLTGRRLVE